jgi:hypothetical protein
VGGARSGKSALICRAIVIRALMAKNSRHAILRFRASAARSSIRTKDAAARRRRGIRECHFIISFDVTSTASRRKPADFLIS